jgi:hypothetical protein
MAPDGRQIKTTKQREMNCMEPIKILALCLVAVFAMSALVASAASATEPYFKVGTSGTGTELTGTKAATIAIGKIHLFLNELGVILTCEKGSGGVTLFNSNPGTSTKMGALKEGRITFEECKIEEAPTCELGNTTIEANEIKGLLGYNGIKVVVLVQPTVSGGTFTTIKIKSKPGEECAISGKYEIKGGLVAGIPTVNTLLSSSELELKKRGATPTWTQEIEIFEEPILKEKLTGVHLTDGGHASSIEGKVTVSVAGEKLGIFTS